MRERPKILFVPVSGPGGAGEYYRSLAVARAVERRWPGCVIRFVLSRDAAYAADSPYPVLPVDRSPTHETRAVVAIIERERPDVVVFDSSGRAAQYRRAQQLGARVVFVSSRTTSRRKGFRWRRMRRMEQHWIVQPRFLGGGLSVLERLRARFAPRCEIVFLDVLHEPVDDDATRLLQRRIGVEPGRYLLVCPGGAGVFGDGPDAAQVYFDAGRELAVLAAMPVVGVLGTRFSPPRELPAGLHVITSLPNSLLMGMLRDARAGVINGGSLLVQAIELGTPCVAAAISSDQPGRISALASRELVQPAKLEAVSLVNGALDLLSEGKVNALKSRITALDLRNGIDIAVAALERLLT